MQTSIAERKPIKPAFIQFFETKARLTGLVREIYKARGWIKETGYADAHYQLTPLGEKMLRAGK